MSEEDSFFHKFFTKHTRRDEMKGIILMMTLTSKTKRWMPPKPTG
jgi:hypothetical protein